MSKAVAKPTEVISLLNGLIETCRDGQKGFSEAAENLEDSKWKTFCLEQSRKRGQYVGELQQQVQQLGGDPENTGSTGAAIHRAWINLKSALDAGDASILSACEAGEDSAVKEYRKALEKDLPSNVRDLVTQQYQGILSTHDQVKAMRDGAKASV